MVKSLKSVLIKKDVRLAACFPEKNKNPLRQANIFTGLVHIKLTIGVLKALTKKIYLLPQNRPSYGALQKPAQQDFMGTRRNNEMGMRKARLLAGFFSMECNPFRHV